MRKAGFQIGISLFRGGILFLALLFARAQSAQGFGENYRTTGFGTNYDQSGFPGNPFGDSSDTFQNAGRDSNNNAGDATKNADLANSRAKDLDTMSNKIGNDLGAANTGASQARQGGTDQLKSFMAQKYDGLAKVQVNRQDPAIMQVLTSASRALPTNEALINKGANVQNSIQQMRDQQAAEAKNDQLQADTLARAAQQLQNFQNVASQRGQGMRSADTSAAGAAGMKLGRADRDGLDGSLGDAALTDLAGGKGAKDTTSNITAGSDASLGKGGARVRRPADDSSSSGEKSRSEGREKESVAKAQGPEAEAAKVAAEKAAQDKKFAMLDALFDSVTKKKDGEQPLTAEGARQKLMASSGPIDPDDLVAASKAEAGAAAVRPSVAEADGPVVASRNGEIRTDNFRPDLEGLDQSLFLRVSDGIGRAVRSGRVGLVRRP